MSPHKAKGLTVKLAVVTGVVQGWLPSTNRSLQGAAKERELAEQRRLFYVAITRPTDALVVSSFLQMPRKVAHQTRVEFIPDERDYTLVNVISSQFVSEFGPTAPKAEFGDDWVTSVTSDSGVV